MEVVGGVARRAVVVDAGGAMRRRPYGGDRAIGILKGVVAETRIVDGRNALDPMKWIESGWQFRALGRPYR